MMERLGLTDQSVARREIERSDAAHAGTVRGFFGVDWQNPLLYHLVLNAASIPIETCVKIVRLLAESPAFQKTESTRSALADKLLELRIRTALAGRFSGMGVSGIEATAVNGKVTLSGTSIDQQLVADAEQAVRSIVGVTEVENRVVVVRLRRGAV